MSPENREFALERIKEALLTGVSSTVDQFYNEESGFRDKEQALRLYRDAVQKLQAVAGRALPRGVDEAGFLDAVQGSFTEIRNRMLEGNQQVLDHLSDDPFLMRRAIERVLSDDLGKSLDPYSQPEKKVSLAGSKEGSETGATVRSVKSMTEIMIRSATTKDRAHTFMTLVESVNKLMDRKGWGIDFDRKRRFEGTETTPAGQYEDRILQGVQAGIDGLYQVFTSGDPQLLARITKDPSGFASRIGSQIRNEVRTREASVRAQTTDI